jgi:hypothetical protein
VHKGLFLEDWTNTSKAEYNVTCALAPVTSPAMLIFELFGHRCDLQNSRSRCLVSLTGCGPNEMVSFLPAPNVSTSPEDLTHVNSAPCSGIRCRLDSQSPQPGQPQPITREYLSENTSEYPRLNSNGARREPRCPTVWDFLRQSAMRMRLSCQICDFGDTEECISACHYPSGILR